MKAAPTANWLWALSESTTKPIRARARSRESVVGLSSFGARREILNNNTGLFVALAVLIGASGLCCTGAGVAYFVFSSRSATSPVAYPSPVYAPPATYPTPVPPSFPSGPSLPPPPVVPSGPLLVETTDTPARGPSPAAITIHVVSDFQCPFCSRVEPTLAQLDQIYPNQIRWVWHDYPLPFHQDAMPAAEAAREVRQQLGDAAFWTYHDQLFAQQQSLDGRSLETLASRLPGIDIGRFRTALVTHQHQAEVRASMALVDATHGSTGTPSFLIGPTWLAGAQPIETFRAEIDRQLGR